MPARVKQAPTGTAAPEVGSRRHSLHDL